MARDTRQTEDRSAAPTRPGDTPGRDHAAGPAAEPVVTLGEGVRVDRRSDLAGAEARARAGGVDLPAALGGTLAAVGAVVLLSGVLAALGTVGYTAGGVGDQALSIAGLVAGLLALGLALLVGGWVAGRAARYDGARNGLLTGLAFVLLTALLGGLGAALGDRFDVARDLQLPTWLDRDTATAAAVASGLLALAVALGAAALGGRLGARWHRAPDEALAGTRAGGLTPYPEETHR